MTSVFDKLNCKIDSRFAELKDTLHCVDFPEETSVAKGLSMKQIQMLKALVAESSKQATEKEKQFVERCKTAGLTEGEIAILSNKVKEQSRHLAEWIVNHESIHKEG